MTVTNTTLAIQRFTGNASTTAFAVTNFGLLDSSHVEVTVDDVVQVDPTDYSLSSVTTSSFQVDFVTAPAASTTIAVRRSVPITQATDYVENDEFPASAHEDALDKLTMIAQEQNEEMGRALKVAASSTVTDPTVEVSADKYLKWDATGTDIDAVALTPSGTIATTAFTLTLLDDSTAAAARQTLSGGSDDLVIDTLTLTAGTGLSGGGDLTANRTFNLDIDSLVAETPVGADDTIPFNDDGDDGVHKATIDNIIDNASASVLRRLAPDAANGTALTSGSELEFTGIPSWVKRVTVQFKGLSTDGADYPAFQIGPSGGVETSGYLGTNANLTGSPAVGLETSFFGCAASGGGTGDIYHGIAVFELIDAANDVWSFFCVNARSDTAQIGVGAGSIAFSGDLSRIKIITAGAQDFDSGGTGHVNLMYE